MKMQGKCEKNSENKCRSDDECAGKYEFVVEVLEVRDFAAWFKSHCSVFGLRL